MHCIIAMTKAYGPTAIHSVFIFSILIPLFPGHNPVSNPTAFGDLKSPISRKKVNGMLC
jgi:hypothetical protein